MVNDNVGDFGDQCANDQVFSNSEDSDDCTNYCTNDSGTCGIYQQAFFILYLLPINGGISNAKIFFFYQ